MAELTPEMIEAGVSELRERCFGEPLAEIVTHVFIAMMAEKASQDSYSGSFPASSTNAT